jgi:polar amino acid transport system substrate-binding protein
MKSEFYFLSFVAILLFTACSNKEHQITDLSGLKGGKTFAVPTGTVADQSVKTKFPDARIIYLNNVLDCALAVKGGKAEAAVYDQPVLQNIAAKYEGLLVLPELLADDQYGFAVQLKDVALKTTMDEVLAELKANGTYEEMMKRWFPQKGSPAAMPEITNEGGSGVLRFGTAAVTEPMSFMDARRKVVGFDIEFAAYIAKKLNKKLEIIDMEFGAMLPALIAGKVDMIGAGLSITEERAKKVLFSKSYYPSGIAALVKGNTESTPEAESGKLRTIDDIKNKRIGVLLGSIHDAYATKTYPQAQILEYQNISDMLNALNSGKVDVGFYDHISLKEVFKNNTQLGIVAKDIFKVPIAAGFNKESVKLRDQFNSFLKEIKSNGVYDDMVDRWMNKDQTTMPVIHSSGANGVLRAGVVGDLGMPFTVMRDGKLVGFDIELSTRFAASIGKEFVPVDMPFGSLIASLSTRKIDLITASMMITDERKKMIDFSDPYFESGVSVIADKKNIEPGEVAAPAIPEDLAGIKIGVLSGTVFDPYIQETYPKAQILRFENTTNLIASMTGSKIDAAMFDCISAGIILRHNPEWGLLREDNKRMQLGVGFNKNNPGLRDEFNAYLKEINQNGIYDSMQTRWFKGDAEKAVMPRIPIPKSGKRLVLGASAEDLPYVSVINGEYVGFDIELIRRFAERNKYNLEIISMNFSSLLASLAAGKVDLIADGIAISRERAKMINFSDPYAELKAVIIAPKTKTGNQDNTVVAAQNVSFWKKTADSMYNNIMREKRYLLIINGLFITILISIFSALFGTLLGGLICFLRMSKKKFLSGFARLYISLLRGTPVLVLLMIIYYVVFASVNINPVVVAVFAFGLNFGAYVSEMFRSSIESIDPGQKEAGIAGGFTKVQTFIHIIFPQALRRVLPVYKGEFISLVKMTSIVGYIAVQDLTKAGDIIRSRTFDAFFPLIMAAAIYLLLAYLLTRVLDYVEISVEPGRKNTNREVEVNK